jgi:uncharacterized protein (TIGR03437 family)
MKIGMTKTQKIVWTAAGTWVALVPVMLLAHSAGPDPRYTGAPGDSPLACASQTCHTSSVLGGPINKFGGSVSAIFSACDHYIPGQAQTITVTVTDPVNSVYGFQMTARYGTTTQDLSNNQAGTFTPGGPDTFVMCDSGSPRGPRGCPSSPTPVEFIEHSAPSRTTFTFTWTPPATNVGPIHFYVAGNAVNNNGVQDGGDHVYTASYVLNPATPVACTTAAPSISQGGVVSASGFGQSKSFAAGSWLEIYGANFATTTRTWGGCDFKGSIAPTVLDNVSVSVNGKPAAVDFVSPGQVNVLAPEDSQVGPVLISLTNCTQTSTAVSVTKADLVPGLDYTVVNGKQYLAAFTLNGAGTGNPNAPAKPGDVFVAYGIGFGDVSPAVTPGTIAGALNKLVNPFTALFGTAPDPSPLYFGLAPGFVGLYQFDLTVPKLADGDYTMSFQVGSVKAAQSLLFTVKN